MKNVDLSKLSAVLPLASLILTCNILISPILNNCSEIGEI